MSMTVEEQLRACRRALEEIAPTADDLSEDIRDTAGDYQANRARRIATVARRALAAATPTPESEE